MTAAGKRRLGRGLEALLGPATTAEASESGDLRRIPLDRIRPNRSVPIPSSPAMRSTSRP